MANIDEKLGKSLDDLIKEQHRSNGSKFEKSSRLRSTGSRGRRDSGYKGRAGPNSRGDAMDIDSESLKSGGRGGALSARGGVRKARPRSVPNGDVDRKWGHDMFEDTGPQAPRKIVSSKAGRRRPEEMLPLSCLEFWRLAPDVTVEDMCDLLNIVHPPKSVKLVPERETEEAYQRGLQRCVAEFETEEQAKAVKARYDGHALDDNPLVIVPRPSKSAISPGTRTGKTISRIGGGGGGAAARRSGASAPGVRGRGQIGGGLRSDNY